MTERGMVLFKHVKPYLRWIGILALIGLVLFLRIDLRETFAILVNANPVLVGLAVLGFVPFLLIKAWRWQVILADLGVPIAFREAVRLYALGLGAGMLTPGQIGDAVKIAYFRERGFGQSIISIVLDRLWDVLILVVLAGFGALFFVPLFEGEGLAIGFLFAATVVVFAVVINSRSQRWFFKQTASGFAKKRMNWRITSRSRSRSAKSSFNSC